MGRLGPFEENTIVAGDCLDVVAQMPDGCVDLVVTSPPYYNAKDYGHGRRMWATHEDYLSWLFPRLLSSWQLLSPNGKLCLIVGDVPSTDDGGQKRNATHCEITSLFLREGARFWAEWIWDKIQRGGGLYAFGSYPYPTNFLPRDIHEHILVFRKEGKSRLSCVADNIKEQSRLDKYTWAEWQQSVWKIPTVTRNDIHPAMFPEEIALRLIRLFSFVGDIVADFFIGSGTTAVVADRLGRKFFGCDINPDYVEMALKRLEKDRAGRQLALL